MLSRENRPTLNRRFSCSFGIEPLQSRRDDCAWAIIPFFEVALSENGEYLIENLGVPFRKLSDFIIWCFLRDIVFFAFQICGTGT